MSETPVRSGLSRERFTALGASALDAVDETAPEDVEAGTYDSETPHEAYGFAD